jgi:diadenosine tetraphosphate (Ap4A) HIT family hydrolase
MQYLQDSSGQRQESLGMVCLHEGPTDDHDDDSVYSSPDSTEYTLKSSPRPSSTIRYDVNLDAPFVCMVHKEVPAGGYWQDPQDTTVFGEILRGTAGARMVAQARQSVAFYDIFPQTPLHVLVIPRVTAIRSVFDLRYPQHEALLREMKHVALDILQSYHDENNLGTLRDYCLCYHIPPNNSVNHLHLHVMSMLPYDGRGIWSEKKRSHYPEQKQRYGSADTMNKYYIGHDCLVARLEQGLSPVPRKQRARHHRAVNRRTISA